MELYGFSDVWGGGIVRIVLGGVIRGMGGLGLLGVMVVPGELKKVSFLPRRPTILKISDMKP